MDLRNLIAFSPAGQLDPAIPIAACRAGARGGLDLEFLGYESVADADAAWSAIETLERHARGEYGVKIGRGGAELLASLLEHRPERLAWTLLAGGDWDGLAETVDALQRRHIEVLLEATSIAEVELAERLGADGVVLKGNESGGRVGDATAFILLQQWQKRASQNPSQSLPAWVQGGIGKNTAAACAAAGATGVVLDNQLLLTRESPLRKKARAWLAAFDGSETLCLGTQFGEAVRIHKRPGSKPAERLTQEEEWLDGSSLPAEQRLAAWREAVEREVRELPAGEVLFLGQDACFADSLAQECVTVSGVLQAVVTQVRHNLDAAQDLRPLDEGAPLAASHGTRFPILQGPMTRVSDTAEFANHVATAGGLPFLALAVLRKKRVEQLLAETKQLLGEKSWGVGLLGFLPPEIRKEQTDAVLANKPPFALIAGGRPDQAKEFEDQGIPTYLHVPSPGLLTMFLKDGAKRFIFEGRECGGHVGPRGSFLLWETMCGLLLKHLGPNGRGDKLHIVFAGGIHDAASAAAVSALAAPLAERGVEVGVLMGTAYLFTREAVAGGAIVPRFQKEAISSQSTVLLETGPGHAIRCINSPYFEHFNAEKRRLRAEGKSKDEITRALEWMNMGRLRVASKGIERVTDETGTSTLAEIPEDEQFARGMYMIGQVAAMHEEIITMAELHEDVSLGGTRRIEALAPAVTEAAPDANPCDIAVIGMSCFYPGSTGLEGYWENILNKVYAVVEVPETHWDWRLYYDPDPLAKDKIISKWGGFMQDVPFEPLRYGITPRSMDSIEPLQMLLLEGVRHAIEDAGYTDRPFNREKTCAVLGIGGGGAPLAVAYGFRACLPLFQTIPGLDIDGERMMQQAAEYLPEWTEDSFPGFLHNVAVGRIANRYDFGGMNMAIDAACASSLAAIYDCVRELQTGASDVAVAMGADTVMTPYAFTAFSKTHALSRRGRCSPFDASGDGIALAEGIGVVMLKRLADAERDGDTIYGVIKGMGSSSDGREKGLTAPNISGQVRALRRAYESAGIAPNRVGLVEAHGTGTVVGDSTEATALISVFREAGAGLQSTALGSVKSMIGHTKCAAGIAGLIKTAKALHHKVLPPTLVEQPNPRINFGESPLYLNADARPWIHGADQPRCGAVSAFGFGGTNFHLVIEEYTGEYRETTPPAQRHWPAELFTWRRASRADIARDIEKVQKALAGTAEPEMGALARSLCKANTSDPAHPTLAIVAASLDDLMTKMQVALETVQSEADELQDPRGIYFAAEPVKRGGKVAFLFPGQGSQYPNMLAQVGINFPEVRETFDQADRTLFGKWEKGLGRYVYPPSTFSPEDDRRVAGELANTEVAQPALGAAGLAMFRLLSSLGIGADYLAGHSYGEYVALCAAGAMSADDLFRVSYERGRLVNEASGEDAGGMVALDADAQRAAELIDGIEGVWLANLNSPHQTVVSGTEDGIKALLKRVQDEKARGRRIPVACAFHSPLVAEAGRPLAKVLSDIEFTSPARPVFSNSLAAAYPTEPDKLASVLADHLGSSVRWQPEIEAMAEAGARVFVEVGPQGVLTGLVKQVLADRPHVAVATDLKGRGGLVQLQHCLAQLLVSGVPMDLDRLYRDRDMDVHDLSRLEQETSPKPIGPLTYLVNGVRAKLYHDPEPYVLGQRMKDNPPSANGDNANGGLPPQPAANGQRHSGAATTNGAAHAAPPQSAPSNGHDSNGHAHHGVPAAANGTSHASHLPSTNGTHALPSAPVHAQQTQNMPAQQPAPTYLPAVDEATYVMQGFQSVMGKFLDTQRSVMLSYLQGGDAAAHAAPATHAVHPAMPMPQPMHYPQPQQPMPQPQQYAPAPQPVPQQPQPAAPAPQAEAPAPAPVAAPAAPAAPAAEPQTAMTRPNEPVQKPAAQPKAEKAGGVPSREEMAEQLLDLVSGRTGYPKEMLGLDLDLEGELGIDSIKRVEILGTLAEGLGTGDEEDVDSKLDLEQLTSLRTLRGILDYLDEALRNPPQPAPSVEDVAGTPITNGTGHAEGNGTPGTTHPAAITDHVAVNGDEHLEVMRGLVRLTDAPLPSGAGAVVPTGTVVVTDDGRGVALELAARLADFDVNVTIVRMAAPGAKGWCADLTDPAAVAELVGRIREEAGPVGGLIHLMPLAERNPGDGWVAQTHRDTKSLYLLARELQPDLQAVGEDGGALMIVATALGGTLGFGDEPLPESFSPAAGGAMGFAKSFSLEAPEVMVRIVDLDTREAAGDLADHVLAELNDPEGPLEIGHRGTQRVTWQPYKATLDTTGEPNLTIPDGATILVTGGARGITARIVEELAHRHKPNVVLVGRSPLPPETEDPETAGLEGQAEIKAVYIKRLQAAGAKFLPADVEKQYQRLLQDREIRGNLARIRAAGATVHYRPVDVRDEAGMTALFAELKETFGGIDGVIHGAGIIDDKLVKDKTLESFDRVFGTKVDSAALIARHLDPERLAFCVFFASIASRYGNRGQSDYAAANEVLSKLARGLNDRMPGRVTAVCWGPWGGIGMVSHLEKHMVKRGLKLIPPAVGAKMLADELLYGSKDQTEVLIAGGEEHEMTPRHSRQRIGQQPAPAGT